MIEVCSHCSRPANHLQWICDDCKDKLDQPATKGCNHRPEQLTRSAEINGWPRILWILCHAFAVTSFIVACLIPPALFFWIGLWIYRLWF